jgi:hypothetical protein
MPTAMATWSASAFPHHREMDREELLLRRVDANTYHQVQDLDVACEGDCVVVTGRSRTYYVKQLATQAVLTAAPDVRIANEIVVVAG